MKLNEMRRMTSKWKLVLQEYEKVKLGQSRNCETVKEICEIYQVNRKDIKRYYERWLETGKKEESLLPHKRGPRAGLYRSLSKEEERLIVKVNRRLSTSAYETLDLVSSQLEVSPSVRTVYRILKRYPLNKKRKEAIKRYEKNYPGEMIHADTKSVTKTMMVDRQRYYLVGLIDDCTRLCYVEVVNRNNAARVSEASIRGLRWFKDHGIKVEEILTDNGGEFTSRAGRQSRETHFFETAIGLFDVRHRYTQPYRPQTNGKIERFWRTLNEECLFLIKKGLSLEELRKEIKAFMYRYNYQRKHSALEYQTPLDKLTFVASLLP